MRSLFLFVLAFCGLSSFAFGQTGTGSGEIYESVQEAPRFPGGPDAMADFFKKNIQYPDSAIKYRKQGIVYLSVVLDENGIVKDVQVKRGLHGDVGEYLNQEAVRVAWTMPKWKPAELHSEKVKVRKLVPVRFALN